MDKGMKS